MLTTARQTGATAAAALFLLAGTTVASMASPANSRSLGTPQAASKNLWDGWRDNDRPRAVLYASPKAVTTLFTMKWRPDVKDRGCDPVRPGGGPVRCFYEYDGGGVNVSVRGNPVDGYRVADVELFGRPTTTLGSPPPPDTAAAPTAKRTTKT